MSIVIRLPGGPSFSQIEIASLDAKFEVVCTPKEQEFVSKKGG
jgi:hypothetical protein